jgi:pantoate--beta-alanine ligase
MVEKGERDCAVIESVLRRLLEENAPAVDLEYIAIVDATSLKPQTSIAGETLVALAARVGKTRLIDNIIVGMQPLG